MKGTFSSVLCVETPFHYYADEHDSPMCRFWEAKRHKCHKTGHLAKACRLKKPLAKWNPPRGQTSKRKEDPWVQKLESEISFTLDRGQEALPLFAIDGPATARTIHVEIDLNKVPLVMEVDTGAVVSLLYEDTLKSKFPEARLQPAIVQPKTYTGEPLEVTGEFPVEVPYQQKTPKKLRVVVVKGKGLSLLGRNWLWNIRLDWQHISSMVSSSCPSIKLDTVLEKYSEVFSEDLGTIKTFQAKLFLKKGAKPKLCRARPEPYCNESHSWTRAEQARESSGAEEGQLQWLGYSSHGIVPWKDGRVRLLWDYKVTINHELTLTNILDPVRKLLLLL